MSWEKIESCGRGGKGKGKYPAIGILQAAISMNASV